MKKTVLMIAILVMFCPSLWAKTITVGPSGDYSTITSAVNAALDNDRIYIQNGIYHESISTSKNGLSFIGETKDEVILTSLIEATGNPIWTKASGYSNVYQCNSSEIMSSTVRGIVDDKYTGMYRQKGSLSEVDTIPGTHYTTNGNLYCHTSDGRSPSEHTMWYTSNGYENTFFLRGGNYSFSNISFIGATQYGIWIKSSSTTLGANSITGCIFRCMASPTAVGGLGVCVQASSGLGGVLNINDSKFLYCCSPTYDARYSIFTDAQGGNHTYQGACIDTYYLDTVNIVGSKLQFARSGTGDARSINYNIRRCLITDIAVHPHMHNISSNHTLHIENSIYSMYGSTTGCRSGSSQAGFKIYLINNTVYTGENPAQGGRDKMWFSATDSSTTVIPSALYIYNNLFIRDHDASSNNGIPLEMYNVPLDRIHMDNNYYTYGRVDGSENGNFIRAEGQNFQVEEWKSYTANRQSAKDANSVYEPNPVNIRIAVSEYIDTLNTNFGKILDGSPLINKGATEFAPTLDFSGRARDSLPDIGAYEHDAAITLQSPRNLRFVESN